MAKLKIKAFQNKTKQNKNPNKFTRTGNIKKKYFMAGMTQNFLSANRLIRYF